MSTISKGFYEHVRMGEPPPITQKTHKKKTAEQKMKGQNKGGGHRQPPGLRGTSLEVLEGAVRRSSRARAAALGILGKRAAEPWPRHNVNHISWLQLTS